MKTKSGHRKILTTLVLISFYVFLFVPNAAAQGTYHLSGQVTDGKNNPVYFASVYIKDSNLTTVTNENGHYKLALKAGKYRLFVKSVGFKGVVRDITVDSSLTVNFRLEHEVYSLQEVKVSPDMDKIAAEMISSVIAKRRKLRSSPSYECDVYTKGVQKLVGAPRKIMGKKVAKTLQLDSNRRGILYESETKSRFYYKYPQSKEIMEAVKVAGDNQGFGFNRAIDFQVNFFKNVIQWKALGNHKFVSPFADNASKYYTYRLVGSKVEAEKTIYKIAVVPKRVNDPVFKGFIYLTKDDLKLYSVDLKLTERSRINFVDTLFIRQNYKQVNNEDWLPSDITIRLRGKVLGFDFDGYFTGLFSNYITNPSFEDNLFNNEVVKIPKDVNKFSNEWWAENRPVPLTQEEEHNYQIKEQGLSEFTTDAERDSLSKRQNKFKPLRYVVLGQRIVMPEDHSYIYVYPLYSSVFYNTVEGWGTKLNARYVKQFSPKRTLEVEPQFRYGFGNKTLNTNAQITYRLDSLKHTSFTLKGGTDFLDLNSRGTLNLFYNTLTTLFNGKNYLKLYRARFASFSAQREVANGLLATIGTEISRRFPVTNISNKVLFDKASGSVTSNNPLYPGMEEDIFPVNNAFSVGAKLSYTYGQTFITRPDARIYEPARYPTVLLNYRKGLKGLFNSVVDYDFLSADIYQDKIDAGLWGYSSFYISFGKFLNNKSLFYPDMRHFNGNQTAIYNPLFPNFHFLDFYRFATDDEYFESHIEHNFSGRYLSRIPLLKKLRLEEIIGGACLLQPRNHYTEAYIGFQRLVFRLDFGFSSSRDDKRNYAVRFFYGF